MEKGAQKQEMQNKKVVRRLLGKIFPCLDKTTCSVSKARRYYAEMVYLVGGHEEEG